MKLRKILLAAALSLTAASAQALTPQEMTEGERRTLPPWCEFTQGFDKSYDAPGHYHDYVARYGEGWTHMHHFCWALASMIRYSRFDTTAMMKRGLATSALNDIDYVLRNIPDDFVLRFDILVRKVRILVMTGALDDAEALSKTIQAEWSDRADSHGLVAEVLIAANRRNDAREVLIDAEPMVKDGLRLDRIRSVLGF